MPRFVSVGECMVEMSEDASGLYRLGYAGDTLNTAWYARARLGEDWDVDYATALGDDLYSQQMVDFFSEAGIGIDHIQKIPGKRPGLYLIHQADGDRHFTYWRGQSAARSIRQIWDTNPELAKLDLTVTPENGRLVFRGTVPNADVWEKAKDTAEGVVRGIDITNHISIADDSR